VTQDPRFGGGAVGQLRAFVTAATALGDPPTVLYARRPPLEGSVDPTLGAVGLPVPVPRLDAVGLRFASRRMMPAANAARSLWVVATTATYGAVAPRTGRPYACWVGTDVESERRARLPRIGTGRRLVSMVNRPTLTRVEREVLRGATMVYATSPFSLERVRAAADLSREQVDILPIPVDAARFYPAAEGEWVDRLERPTLLFVGRSDDPRKNLDLLLDAFTVLRDWVPNARLRVVGAPSSRALPAGAESIGVVDDLPSVLRKATILVVPSRQEGFGIAAAEAMAAGLPVVATPCGGPEDLIRASGGGRVLESFDPGEMAVVLAQLMSDEAALLAHRRSGRAYVEREHSPSMLRERLAGAFRRLACA
jgi:glycosyltransferase involved in cell wall biosynthesis